MRKLTEVRWNKKNGECTRWETVNGDYIVKDEFGYSIKVNETYEHAETFANALNFINSDRY